MHSHSGFELEALEAARVKTQGRCENDVKCTRHSGAAQHSNDVKVITFWCAVDDSKHAAPSQVSFCSRTRRSVPCQVEMLVHSTAVQLGGCLCDAAVGGLEGDCRAHLQRWRSNTPLDKN
mmetsp:Transcript_14991/g.20978  ORF Transcript_14991/g.20978 Transcript_14991/m.20978 type:complete len:120 (-) Transcript_14991:1902-2261(-)